MIEHYRNTNDGHKVRTVIRPAECTTLQGSNCFPFWSMFFLMTRGLD